MTRATHRTREGLARAPGLVRILAFASGSALFGALLPVASVHAQAAADSGVLDSGAADSHPDGPPTADSDAADSDAADSDAADSDAANSDTADSDHGDSAAADASRTDSGAVGSASADSSRESGAAASVLSPTPDLATVIGLDLTAALPAPLDPGAFPPPPPNGPGPTRPYFELHGFLSTWLTLVQDPVPGVEERDSFRLRFVVLRVDARLSDQVRMLARLGFMAPGNPLLDVEATWEPISEVALSIGQMRMPFGASATTLAPQLVFLDRPRYVQAMLKATFRDVGLLVHSGARGVFDGVLHYRLAVMNGGGRLGVSTPRGLNEPERFLYVGRVMVDVGRLVTGGPRDRLVLGGSYARSRDPGIDTGDLAADRVLADSILGRRLAPLGLERETQVGGVDLTFSAAGFWAQAEWMYLDSSSVDGSAHTRSQGASLELAYTPDWHPYDTASLRVALRGEYFDPSLDRSGDESGTGLAGVDFDATHGVRVGVFGGATIFRDVTRGREEAAAELTLRAQYGF